MSYKPYCEPSISTKKAPYQNPEQLKKEEAAPVVAEKVEEVKEVKEPKKAKKKAE